MDSPILRAFLGTKADYYIPRFEAITQNKTRWNWAAFIFGIGWLSYRGMHKYTAIIGIAIIIETVIEVLLNLPDSVSNGVTIGLYVAFGLLGNTAYKVHTFKQIEKIQSMGLSESEQITLASKNGKTSVLAGFIAFIIFAALLVGIMFVIPLPAEV